MLFSLFEEQIRHEQESLDYLIDAGTETFAESLTYFPAVDEYRVGPDSYLELIRAASEGGRHPDHRQPERRHQRRLDRSTPAR